MTLLWLPQIFCLRFLESTVPLGPGSHPKVQYHSTPFSTSNMLPPLSGRVSKHPFTPGYLTFHIQKKSFCLNKNFFKLHLYFCFFYNIYFIFQELYCWVFPLPAHVLQIHTHTTDAIIFCAFYCLSFIVSRFHLRLDGVSWASWRRRKVAGKNRFTGV